MTDGTELQWLFPGCLAHVAVGGCIPNTEVTPAARKMVADRGQRRPAPRRRQEASNNRIDYKADIDVPVPEVEAENCLFAGDRATGYV